MRRIAAFWTASAVGLGTLVVAAAAVGAPVDILSTARVTVTASPNAQHDFINAVEYDPTNTISATGSATTTAVHVALTGGTLNIPVSLDLLAPTASAFHTGTYFGDDVYGVRGWGWLAEGGESCDYVQFTIVDIASSGSSLTRLDVRFQTVCYQSSNVDATIFGELQLGEPEPSSAIVTGARSPSWPEVAVGSRSHAEFPLWVRNAGTTPVTLGTVTRAGSQSSDFPIVADGCSHTILAPHTGCSVVVGFNPSAAGTRSATVRVPAGSTQVSTTLNGVGSPGQTLLRMSSQPGDFVGAGKTYSFTDSQDQVSVATRGPGTVVEGFENFANTEGWMVQVGAPGGAMTLGTHATTATGTATQWGLWVSGDGRSCGNSTGSVTVKQLAFSADNAPTAFDMTFTQTCSGSTASLTGEIEYHATPSTPPPPTIYANDAFNRTVVDGLGVASPIGGTWTATAPGALSVTPGQANATPVPGQTTGAYLRSVSQMSTELLTTISLKSLPIGGSGYYLRVISRRATSTEQYFVIVKVVPGGKLTMALAKVDGSATAAYLSATKTIGTVTAGASIHLRLDTTGTSPTTLRARAWLGSTEPTQWTATATDASAALQTHGSPGFTAYLAQGTTGGAVSASLAGFRVTSG